MDFHPANFGFPKFLGLSVFELGQTDGHQIPFMALSLRGREHNNHCKIKTTKIRVNYDYLLTVYLYWCISKVH